MFHSQVSSKAMIWELERVPSLRLRSGQAFFGEEDVVVLAAVEGRVEVDEVDGLRLDVLAEDGEGCRRNRAGSFALPRHSSWNVARREFDSWWRPSGTRFPFLMASPGLTSLLRNSSAMKRRVGRCGHGIYSRGSAWARDDVSSDLGGADSRRSCVPSDRSVCGGDGDGGVEVRAGRGGGDRASGLRSARSAEVVSLRLFAAGALVAATGGGE